MYANPNHSIRSRAAKVFIIVPLFKLKLTKSLSLLLQAVAPTRQGNTLGRRRHSWQTTHYGGPQVQHPQVCPGGLRPRHDPPEPSQPQPWLCSLQLPVEGNGEPCVHPQPATMHFSLVLKQQVGQVLLTVESVFTLWSEEVAVAAQSPGL